MITGTQGTIQWDGLAGKLRVYGAETETWEEIATPSGFERNTLFLDEMRHFLQVVAGQARPVCTLEDGVFALHLCLASKESSSTGRVVELSA
jgi:predicted dehydrogenase